MKIDANAPAFPHHVYPQHSGPGLTIRAYFAGMAMPALISVREADLKSDGESVDYANNEGDAELLADECLAVADALIAALNAEDKG